MGKRPPAIYWITLILMLVSIVSLAYHQSDDGNISALDVSAASAALVAMILVLLSIDKLSR